jgi:hypothetical protein
MLSLRKLLLTGLAAGSLAACQQERDPGSAAEEMPAATLAPEPGLAPAAELTCSDPVRANDTAASLRERYGDDARVETLYGPEAIELPGVVLWPDDPSRRVEVIFSDETRRHVSLAQLSGASERRVAGLTVGDPIVRAHQSNGRAFELWGFSWDYGGFVSDFKGGELEKLPGGCGLLMRLGPREDAMLPDALLGEVQLLSDDPRLEAAGVRIEELSLAFNPG